jgi:hypothetical protein
VKEAPGLRTEIAISVLLVVGLAGDDVHREPSIGQMAEPRNLAAHGATNPGRCATIAELICVRGRVKRDEERFRGRRGVSNKREVKTGVVVCACNLHQITRGQGRLQ